MESIKISDGNLFIDEDVLGALSFASEADQTAILGSIAAVIARQSASAQPKLMRQAIRKMVRPSAGNIAVGKDATSRDEAMRRFDALPVDVISGLTNKRLALANVRYYWNKVANAVSSVEMIKPDDAIAVGKTNVANGKLEEGKWFLPTGIILLSGVATDILNTAYDTIALAIANGDFEFRANDGKYILPNKTNTNIFASGRTDQPKGYFKLENPKWLKPLLPITFDLAFSQASAANTNVHLALDGVVVSTY